MPLSSKLFQAKGRRLGLTLLLAVACLLVLPAAQPWALMPPDDIVAPPGAMLNIYTGAYANSVLISQGKATASTKPFTDSKAVDEVRTSQTEHWVRTYNYDPTRVKDGAVGSWLMRAGSLRGMTPEQIRDLFALPALPTHITSVKVPAGAVVWTGPAGPITGWGDGGGQQMYLTDRISADQYLYQRAIGANALWYAPVTSNNARRVGAYFDHLPKAAPYSDLAYVYSMLDYLEPIALQNALNQIGPQRYDTLTQLGARDSLLFTSALTRRSQGQCWGKEEDCGFSHSVDGFNLWGRMVWAMGKQQANLANERFGWNYQTAGLVLGVDFPSSPDLVVGVGLGVLMGDYSWGDHLGDNRYTQPQAGVYVNRDHKDWFLDAAGTIGLRQDKTSRVIAFEGMDRTASASPRGHEAGLRLGGGLKSKLLGWDLQPFLTTDLMYQSFRGFDESGADSLNLHVDGWEAWSLRGETGLRLSQCYVHEGGVKVRPEFKLGVAAQQALDSRNLSANLLGQPGGFAVQGDTRTQAGLVPSLGLTVRLPAGTKLYGFYEAEVRDDFLAHQLSVGVHAPF